MPSSPDLNEGDPVVSGAGVLFEHQLTECALVVSDSVLSSGILLLFYLHYFLTPQGLSQVNLRPFSSDQDNVFNIAPWTILFDDSMTSKQGVVTKGSYVRYGKKKRYKRTNKQTKWVFINLSRFIDPEAGLLKAPSIFSKTSQGHDVVRARKYKNPSDGLLDYSTIWKIEEEEDATSSAFGSV